MIKRKNPWVYKKGAGLYDQLHHLQTLWTDDKFREMVAEKAGFKEGDRILDIGTGTALTAIKSALTQAKCKITGIDVSKEMLEMAKRNIQKYGLEKKIKVVECNLENLPFESCSFDKIISCYGLGGIENFQKALEEIIRVAVPGALVCLAELVRPPKEYPIKRFLHKYFVGPCIIGLIWSFRHPDLISLFKRNNIEIIEKHYFTEKIFGSTMLIKGVINKK